MLYNNFKELNQDLPNKGRLIGLDIGTKNIGVAISDSNWTICNPKITIKRKANKLDFALIKQIFEENKIVAIVIGLPLNMDNSESKMSEFVRRFANNLDQFLLTNKIDSKIIFVDERLSSFGAEELMEEIKVKNNKRKGLIDQIAASIILNDGLNQLQKFYHHNF